MQAIAWHGEDLGEGADPQFWVYAFGRTPEGESACVRVPFTPYWFVRVGDAFGSMELAALKTQIRRYLGDGQNGDLKSASIVRRKTFHGFTNEVAFPFVLLVFTTQVASRRVAGAMRSGRVRVGAERSPRLYETQLDPVLRLMHVSEVESTGWIDLTDVKAVDSESRHTHCVWEYQLRTFKELRPMDDPGTLAPFRIASYDIETYSPDGTFPNPLRECPIVQIGVTVWDYGKDTHAVLFSVGTCDPVPGATVVSCASERDLLIAFADWMTRTDPDAVLMYNGWGFDDRYVCIRSQKTGCNVHTRLGRLRDRPSSALVSKTLSSSALGDNNYDMLEYVGRVPMDLLQMLKRDHKLESYSLNAVSQRFLNDRKKDLTPAQLFDKVRESTPAARAEIGTYCVYDTHLPVKLVETLAMLPNLIEMARACWVPVAYLLLRGQQIKVFSQIAYFTRQEQIVIESNRAPPLEDGYVGATVLPAQTNAYMKDVITCLDFASLYPSIMRAYNLCHTTLVARGGEYDDLPEVDYEDIEVEGRTVRFVQNRSGILPRMLEQLAKRRKVAKKDMAAAAARGDAFAEAVYNGKQLAFKVSMNSIYGFCGSTRGMLPCPEVSSTTTAIGRQMIERTKTIVETEYPGARVVYGDTDSVFVNFRADDPDPVERMKRSFALGEEAAQRITRTFKPPIELEFEKCYFPLLLFKKKRYMGVMFEADKGPYEMKKIDAKGTEIVRRDNAPFVKQLLHAMSDALLMKRDVALAVRTVEEAADRLLANQVPIEDLVISKTMRDLSNYKNPEHAQKTFPHLALAEKIRQRNPGSEPRSGDRVPYVFIETHDPRELQGVKAEDPVYTKEHALVPDVAYYLEHALIQPTLQILGLFVEDPKREIFGPYLDRLKEQRTKRLATIRQEKKMEQWGGKNQRPLRDFFGGPSH